MRYGGADRSAAYLKSVECDFDQNMPWSSWSVEIPWETLEETIGKSGRQWEIYRTSGY